MSTDLKIEMFAYFTFQKFYRESGIKLNLVNPFEHYRVELDKEPSFSEVIDDRFNSGIRFRMMLFAKIFSDEFDYDKIMKWRSLSDIYDHVTKICDRDDLFGHLTIFDRMLATCAYVQDLSIRMYDCGFKNTLNYVYVTWAMYFDKFAARFYNEGGWNELRRETNQYEFLINFACSIKCKTELYLHVMNEASLNYCHFKKAVKYGNRKYKQKSRIHVCKLWVKFHTEHFEDYVRIPLSYGENAESIDIELLLQRLKLICTLLKCGSDYPEILQDEFQEKFYSTGMLFSKSFVNNDKVKPRDDLRLEILRNSMIACKELLESRKCLDIHFQREYSADTEKIVPHEMIEKTENVKKNSSEMDMPGKKSELNIDRNSPNVYNNIPNRTTNPQFDTNTDVSDKIADFDLNYKNSDKSFDNENKKNAVYSSIKNEKRHLELLHAGNASSLNQKNDIQWNKNMPLKNLPNTINPYSENVVSESYNGRGSPTSSLKGSFYVKIEGYDENTEKSCVYSPNQMAVSHCERNVIRNKMSAPKGFLSVKEVTHNDDELINANRELDKSREEQADPDTPKDFLSVKEVTHNDNGSINTSRELDNQREEQADPDTPKDFLAVKEVKHNDGSKNSNRTLDKLREEQADNAIRNFLRMILVLGDKQGIQCVRGTLCNSEEGQDNSQIKPKKGNKRSKKKPRK